MRPDKQTIDAFRELDDIIGRNIDSLVEDFVRVSSYEVNQSITNALFTSFVMGAIVPINPESSFNKNFVMTPKSHKREVGA